MLAADSSCTTSDDLASSGSSSSGGSAEYLFILDILRRIMDEIDWLLKNEKLSPSDVLASLRPYMESWSQGLLSKVSSSSSISSDALLVTACNSLSSVVAKFESSIPSPLLKDTREVATTTNLFPPNDVDVKLVIDLSDSSSSDTDEDDESYDNDNLRNSDENATANDIVPSFISSRMLKPFISKNSSAPMSFAAATAGKRKTAAPTSKPPVAKIQVSCVKNIDAPSDFPVPSTKKFSWAQIVTRSMPTTVCEQKSSSTRKSSTASTSSTTSTSHYESVIAKPSSPTQEKKTCPPASVITKSRPSPIVTVTPRKSLLLREKKTSPKIVVADSQSVSFKPVNASTSISSATSDQHRLNETRRVLEMLASSATADIAVQEEAAVRSPVKKSKETILQEKREILQQKLDASTQLRTEQISERRRKAAAVVKKSKQVVERKHEITADFEFQQQPLEESATNSVKSVFISRIKTVALGVKYIQNLLKGIEDDDAAVNIDYLRELYLKKSSQHIPTQKLFDLNISVLSELLLTTGTTASALMESTSQFLLDVAATQGQLFLQYPEASTLNRDLFGKYLTIVGSQSKTNSLSANKHTCHSLLCISSLCSIFCNSRLKSHALKLEKATATFIVKFCTEQKVLDMMRLTIETLQESTEFPWPRHYLELIESFTTILSLITDIFCFEEYDNKIELFSQFSEAMKRTEFVGLVTMLNSVLLHPNNNKSTLNIPTELITASFNVLRMMNNFASVDIDEFQSIFVGNKGTTRSKCKNASEKTVSVAAMTNPIIQTQLFHLISFFLKYCTEETSKLSDFDHQNPKSILLLHETILLIGYSVSSNRVLQSMVRFGQYPVILQRLLKLPIEYLIRPRLGHIFIPTLILCCEDPDNLLIMRQEVSPKYLYQYLQHNNNQPAVTELPSRFLYSKRINPSIWQKMQKLLSTL